SEKDANGQVIDYMHAVSGHLQLAPTGQARDALAEDYALMVADDVMVGQALAFNDLMQACEALEQRINAA
ncbi:nucleotidyl transferase AbiEii/AbiGii toxin family protein, partial [Acinetobacter baumannii]